MNTSSTSSWSRGGPFPRRSIEIGVIVVSFVYWWPLGLAYIAWKVAGYPTLDRMQELARSGTSLRPWGLAGAGASRFAQAFEAARGHGVGSGNWAFEEYRRAEIERLEARRRALKDESRAFSDFVDELKRARDREQFDAFMAKRRSEGRGPTIEA